MMVMVMVVMMTTINHEIWGYNPSLVKVMLSDQRWDFGPKFQSNQNRCFWNNGWIPKGWWLINHTWIPHSKPSKTGIEPTNLWGFHRMEIMGIYIIYPCPNNIFDAHLSKHFVNNDFGFCFKWENWGWFFHSISWGAAGSVKTSAVFLLGVFNDRRKGLVKILRQEMSGAFFGTTQL